MSKLLSDEELAKEIVRIFDGGIHAKGSERGGYPTYFEKPYPLWVQDRLDIVTRLINQQVVQALERAKEDGYSLKNEYRDDVDIVELSDIDNLIKEYKGDKG